MEFKWIEWNLDKVHKHGVRPEEAEWVVLSARRPYPRRAHDERWLVHGQEEGGRFLQVVYLLERDGIVFIIHARPLTTAEKRKYRKGRR